MPRTKLNHFFGGGILILSAISLFLFAFGTAAHSIDSIDSIDSMGIHHIHMIDGGFAPREIVIKQGDTVVFENTGSHDHWPASNVHPTHEIYSAFDAGKPIPPGEDWSFSFDETGQWEFHDHLQPQFTGTIIVERSGAEAARPESDTAPRGIVARVFEFISNFFSKFFGVFSASTGRSSQGQERMQTEFREPPEHDSSAAYEDFEVNCDPDHYACVAETLRNAAIQYGPRTAVELLELWREDGRVLMSVDEHQLAHEIGRQTAESFGVNSQAFLLCPMSSFNGACQHGFFEYVLGKTGTTTAAADLICESLDDSYSQKFRFYCYHGMGHGVMMAQAYDLQGALEVCDTLEVSAGCWQGVFMENVVAGMEGIARKGVFSASDPLEPCSGVEEKYRWQCYINHSGYLMGFFDNSIAQAASACLEAGEDKTPCLQSLGLLTTNPSWQNSITGKNDFNRNVEIALQLCDQFPQEAQIDCLIGALDNILNYDEVNLSRRAIPFCEQVTRWTKEACYRQIGINIARQVVDVAERKKYCELGEPEYHQFCFMGAGV